MSKLIHLFLTTLWLEPSIFVFQFWPFFFLHTLEATRKEFLFTVFFVLHALALGLCIISSFNSCFCCFGKRSHCFFFFSKNKWRQLVVNFKMFLIYTLTLLFALRLRTLEGVSNSCWCLGIDLASCTQWTLGHFFAPPPSPLHSPLFLCLISCALYFSVLFIENFSWIGILDLLIKFPCPLIFLSWVFNLKRRPLDWGVF